MNRFITTTAVCLLNLLLLSACGNKGPLYIPAPQAEEAGTSNTSAVPLANNPTQNNE